MSSTKGEVVLMSERRLSLSAAGRCGVRPLERRRGGDRRSGRDRRTVDLWRETGRPGFDLRTSEDRRSGEDRRTEARPRRDEGEAHPAPEIVRPEIVTPWQIAEPRVG
jgi:hypothetical protein